MQHQPLLDRPAIATLVAGSLLISISLLTNCGHEAFIHFLRLRLMRRPEFVSTLTLLRSCLAILNWRPAYEIEMHEIESKKRSQRLDIEQLTQTKKQVAAIEQRTLTLLLNAKQ
jgi:hypothetical protein